MSQGVEHFPGVQNALGSIPTQKIEKIDWKKMKSEDLWDNAK
jgi:hypothetical protein